MKISMRHLHCFCGLVFLTFALSNCGAQTAGLQSPPIPTPTPTSTPEVRAAPTPEASDDSKLVRDYFVDEDSLSYRGYNLVRKYKKVKTRETPDLTEISYAVLTKNGKKVATFDDGNYHLPGLGNATDFGLFPLFGSNTKQIVISQTVPRGGRHWILSLSPAFRVLYDSEDYKLGREEMTAIDIDKDGVYEITQELTAFVFFEDITLGATHIIDVLLKYDEKSKRYLPASHIFKDYTLTGASDLNANLNHSDEKAVAGDVLRAMLPYIYAGEREEAWEFYEREYALPNKEELKGKIMARLEDEAVYKYIYRKP